MPPWEIMGDKCHVEHTEDIQINIFLKMDQ
jgi:hypothetical protein